MAAADFPVGHFGLPLLINTDPIEQITADYKEGSYKRFVESKIHRPERHAIRNLLGVLAFRREKVQEAKDYFNKILEPGEDPDNLNAKANLSYVERQTLSDEEYVTSSVGIAASNLGPDVSEETEKKRQGRRYAEQAFAFMYENYHETLTHERYSKAMELYTKAMNLTGNLVDSEEKDDWHLGIGLASMKIFKSIRKTKDNHQDALRHLQTTVTNNCAVINSKSADRDMKSEAFLRIGVSFDDMNHFQPSDTKIEMPPNLSRFNGETEMCFKKALEVAISDLVKASIYTRFASIRNRARDFHRAMEYLNESIRLDGSKYNFHAYSTRANICLKQLKQKTAGRRRGLSADLGLLNMAKTDLEFILKDHVSPMDFRNLADVYYRLATTSTDRQSEDYIKKALDMCCKSEACQDGADSPNCHKIKGQCLCFMGKHQKALESFKRGLECEKRTGWKCGIAQLLHIEETHLP